MATSTPPCWAAACWTDSSRVSAPAPVHAPPCSLTFTGLRYVLGAGPSNTHRRAVEDSKTYRELQWSELNDNPIYRLPEVPAGGHRLDGQTQQQARKAALQHH